MSAPLLLHDAFLAAAERFPARVAATHGDDSRTFGEIAAAVPTYARALAAAGVRRGDRVGSWCDTDLDLVPLYLACAALGVTFTPANPAFGADEGRAVFDLADPRIVVVDDAHTGDLHLADLARSTTSEGIEDEPVAETDGHIMFFTSGTTGRPKAIELSHRVDLLRCLAYSTEFPGGSTVSMFPLFHMSGWSSATPPWLRGEEVVFADGADADGLLAALERRRAERFYAIPAVWRRVLQLDLAEFDLTALAVADTGTSATTPDLLDAIHDALPHTRTSVTYGSTEAGAVCRLAPEDIRRKPGRVGPPCPGVRIRVDDSNELWTTSPFLFDGYFRDPDATATVLDDGWYRTGDLAEVDADGYVTIVGRASEMIRTGGETVAPAEVDIVIGVHPAVADAAVAGVPHEDWGEVVGAFVVLEPGATLSLAELQEHCATRLARYKVPRRLVILDALPRTGATRQIERRALPALASTPHQRGTIHDAPTCFGEPTTPSH